MKRDSYLITPSQSQFLRVDQVADRLQLSRSKIYQLVENRTLPSYKIDGSIRISERDLNNYLDKCQTEPKKSEKTARVRLKHVRLTRK